MKGLNRLAFWGDAKMTMPQVDGKNAVPAKRCCLSWAVRPGNCKCLESQLAPKMMRADETSLADLRQYKFD